MMHFVYKITNLVNGKFYIGVHSTEKLYDGYMGSGVLLRKSFKKYGKINFSREILRFFETRDMAFKYESELVGLDLVNSLECYNLTLGGGGGGTGPLNGMYGKTHSEEFKLKLSKLRKEPGNPLLNYNKLPRPESHCKAISRAAKARMSNPENNPMYGKRHSEESKIRMSEAQSKERHWSYGIKGVLNHNYGRKHSEESRANMSIARGGRCNIPPQPGKLNPRWLGYYHTPIGVFETSQKAADALGISRSTIRKRCKSEVFPKYFISEDK